MTTWVESGHGWGHHSIKEHVTLGYSWTSSVFSNESNHYRTTWVFTDLSGRARVQTGSVSQLCTWTLDRVQFGTGFRLSVDWSWPYSIPRWSSSGLSSVGGCGVTEGHLAADLGYVSSATPSDAVVRPSSTVHFVNGWYPVTLPQTGGTYVYSPWNSPTNSGFTKGTSLSLSTTFGPGAPVTIP